MVNHFLSFTVEIEQFTDCYHVEFEKVHCARRAKHKIDRKNFYGGKSILNLKQMTAVRNHILSILSKGILHVSYAPEYESVADVRDKLKSRARDIRYRLKKLNESADVSIKRPTSDGCENEPLTKRSNLTDTNLSTQ